MPKLFEDFLKIRIKGKPSKRSDAGLSGRNTSLAAILGNDSSSIINLEAFQSFRTLGNDRNEQYRMYDEMGMDAILSAALELYTDDATQYNSKGQIIWAESDDPQVAQFANYLIDSLQLNNHAWSHIYSLIKYGDLYLELFKDDELNYGSLITKDVNHSNIDTNKSRKGAILENYLERVPNPAELFDLSSRGKTVGFARVDLSDNSDQLNVFRTYQYNQSDNNVHIYEPDKYVHIMLANETDRFPEKLELTYDTKSESSDPITISYNVKRGKSILHDLYKIYREIQLMEDSLLLNRVTRSSIIRLLQIEVGDMPKNQVEELLRRYKRMIEQKNFMDKDEGKFTSAANPGPIENILYIPTRDGKGSVSTSNLGGDVDVHAITDVDYFKNKLYGALKIPKQFLGEDDGGGFSGGTSLTKLDARYARTIKRIQTAYISGITTLVNIFALDRGLNDYVNNFTIKMTSPSTTEDAERDETLDNRISIVDRLMGLIPEEMIEPETRKKILVQLISEYLSEPDIADEVDKDEKDLSPDADMSSEGGGGGGGFGGPGMDDFGGPEDFGEEPMEEPEGGEEPADMGEEPSGEEEGGGAESEINFNDIEI